MPNLSDQYSIPQLREIISLGKQLGFKDDVEHFTKLLDEKLGENHGRDS